MDDHLDVHYSDFPRVFPCIGQIKAVKAKDHANNPTGTFTVYDLTLYMQWPTSVHDFENVPVAGQMASGAIEIEITYAVDQYVLVGFVEGDQNRPYIQSAWPWHDTAVAHADGEGPRVRLLINGAEILIDKDGNISLVPKSGEEVGLGALVGDAALKKLMTEAMITAFNAHTHTGVTTGPGSTGAPSVLLSTGSHATSVVKGK